MKYCGSLALHTVVGNINDADEDNDNNSSYTERSYLCPGNDVKVTSMKFAKSIAPDFTEWHLERYKYRFDMFPIVFQIQCSPF